MSIARSISPGRAAPRGVNVVDLGYKCLEMFPDSHRRRGDLQTVAATWLLQPAHSHCNEAGACLICRGALPRAGRARRVPTGTARLGSARLGKAQLGKARLGTASPLRPAPPGPAPPGPARLGATPPALAGRRGSAALCVCPLLLGAEPIKIRTFLLKGITITIEPLSSKSMASFPYKCLLMPLCSPSVCS